MSIYDLPIGLLVAQAQGVAALCAAHPTPTNYLATAPAWFGIAARSQLHIGAKHGPTVLDPHAVLKGKEIPDRVVHFAKHS